MTTGLFISVQTLLVGASVAAMLFVVASLAAASGRLHTSRASLTAIGVALAVWFGLDTAIAQVGGYSSDASFAWGFPLVAPGLLVPMIIAVVIVGSFGGLRRLVQDSSAQPSLIAVQLYRAVGGAVFVYLMFLGQLPVLFALPAGAGDVLVGLTAVGAARALGSGRSGAAIAWNLLGILDLLVAVGLGITTTPGPTNLFTTTPTTTLLTVWPLVVVPTFLVPLSLLLHIVSLRFALSLRTRGDTRTAQTSYEAEAPASRVRVGVA